MLSRNSSSASMRIVYLLALCSLAFCLSITDRTAAQTAVLPQKVLLQGKVVDPDNAVVPGATITIAAGNQSASSLTTNLDGQFSLLLLPGNYEIRANAEGFAEVTKPIELRSSTTIELTLPVATSSAIVTITDTAGYGIGSISSATRTLTSLRDIPQSISVVTNEQIREQSMASVADVVNYVPGIASHQGENNRDQLVIRGNSTSADFFLNGVRDDVQYYRDLYNVERVEALKGPNSMTFGRGGGGGVVNRVTKQAGFSSLREVTAQGGSFGNKRFTLDFDQPFNNKIAARLNGVFEDSDSFRRYVSLQRYGLNPTITFVPDTKTAITFSYEYFHDRRIADRGIPSFRGQPADIPIETYFGDPKKSRVKADVNLASASIDRQLGRFSIRNRAMFGDYDRFYQNFVPGAVTADRNKVSLSAYNNATKRRNLFNQTDVTFAIATGRIKHSLLTGMEFGRQQTRNIRNTGFFNNTSTTILAPFDNPTINTPVTFRQNATDADNRITANLAATYLQDQIELSKKFQVIAGLRFDYFDLHFHNNRNDQVLRRIDRLFAPRVGFIYKPATDLSLYANYGVAYLPSSGDQFSSLTAVTQQVKPEKFSNYEVGAKWDIRRNLSLTTALYRQDRTNTRATDPNDPARILQTGRQRTNGYELGVNGRLTTKWTVTGGYAYQDALISSDTVSARAGARVALVPHQSFSLWNNYRLLSRLSVGMGIIHRSDVFAAVDNAVTLPGFTRADAALFFTFNEHWRLQANLQNLFDRKYFVNADGNNNISPGSPRMTRVSIVTRF